MPKENIVIGVHDLVPPQGLVTVRLIDPDRPWRVRKEVKGENLLTNWWLSGGNAGFRNGNVYQGSQLDSTDTFTQYKVGFAPNAGCTTVGFTKYNEFTKYSRPGVWPGMYGNYINKFWASSANVTPDATQPWIPTNDAEGALTAYSCTDQAYILSADHAQRGTVVFQDSFITWNKSRTTMEWGTTQGNGVWRSLGYGGVNSRNTGSVCAPAAHVYGARPSLREVRTPEITDEWPNYGFRYADFAARIESASWDPAGGYFYWAGNDSVGCWNNNSYTSVYGATAITTGTGRVTVVHDGTDLWVARGKSVYRVLETDPNNITNTYDLSSNITESDIRDITTDGTSLYLLTSTHVHVVTASTGAWSSSWTHGRTSTGVMEGNVEYDYGMGFLWISFDPNYVSSTSGFPNPWNMNSSGSRTGTEGDDFRVRAFAVGGGTQLNYAFKPGWYEASYEDDLKTGFTGLDAQGWVGFISKIHDGDITEPSTFPLGPNKASHLLLPSDITKTSSDTLQVVYDFDYS